MSYVPSACGFASQRGVPSPNWVDQSIGEATAAQTIQCSKVIAVGSVLALMQLALTTPFKANLTSTSLFIQIMFLVQIPEIYFVPVPIPYFMLRTLPILSCMISAS